eukprot:11799160-Karenia_brevis.AAC.1
MAQRSQSCPARVESRPDPPPYPPWGWDPPRLNADSFRCPRCACTEFRLYTLRGFVAFACYQCKRARAMAILDFGAND